MIKYRNMKASDHDALHEVWRSTGQETNGAVSIDDGFEEMVLDTITPLQSAIHLYKKFGFEGCEPYYDNPMNDVVYMRKKL